MDYKVFLDLLEKEIYVQCGEIQEIERRVIRKNNDVQMDAFILYGPDRMIAPTIYPQLLYELYDGGVSVKALGLLAVRAFREAKDRDCLQVDSFFDYSRVKDAVYCRLISRIWNKEMMRELCHEDWMDLAVAYYHQISMENGEEALVQIRYDFLPGWGISEEQLRGDAWRNTLRDRPPELRPLDSILQELCGHGEWDASPLPLYVLSNEQRTMGAVSIACPGEAEAIALELDSDYFVIPSSIHECLILADDGSRTEADLSMMVREVNRSQVSPQEVLSDHVYRYRRGEGFMMP